MSIDRKEDYNPTILSRKLMVIDKIQKEVINQQDIPAVEDQLFEMAEEKKLVSSSKKGTRFGPIDLINAASENPFNSINGFFITVNPNYKPTQVLSGSGHLNQRFDKMVVIETFCCH